ncbi:MAG: AMP-binding protein, partial [Verrucomicrobia bacterium]|nr:AMP-binding protein [Verrucomicrobiota bacterium]
FDQISYTWEQYGQQAKAFAKSLIAMKVKPQTAVAIQGSNSSHWLFANIGTILAGGISAGVYPTNNPETSKHAVVNSGAAIVVVEDEKQLAKYVNCYSTPIKCFVVWNKVQDERFQEGIKAPVLSWDEFMQKGENISDEKLRSRMSKQHTDHVCSLIYTSGTTGLPKAAALTHDNLTWTASRAGEKFGLSDRDNGISYLPLSHIAAQQIDCIAAILFGYKIDIAPPTALKGNNLKQHITQARPTCFLAVPRVWEKFKEGIEEKLADAPWHKKMLFDIATRITSWTKSSSSSSLESFVKSVVDCTIGALFNKVIITPVKAALGLDACRIAASGAAPLDPKVAQFFTGLNIHIIDLFGSSECSGPATLGDVDDHPIGSCGKALAGTDLIIAEPDENGEGEIRLSGRHVFHGYWGNESATRESFDDNNYFRTGDIGKLDGSGNLYITGRLKELLKTSGGENIPPVRIEQKIQQELSIVSQAVVIGNNKNYLTCLLTLKTEQDNPEMLAQSVVAELAKLGSHAKTPQEASQDPLVQEYLKKGIERANRQADSQAQQVQKFKVIADEFSVANGLMTATLKLRRAEIVKRYNTLIEEMYSS